MSKRSLAIAACAVLAGFLATTVPAAPQATGDAVQVTGEAVNVLVKFRIGRLENGKRTVVKSYDLVVAAGTGGSTLLSGHRVPFPMDGDEGPRLVYQNIGFVTTVEARIVDAQTIRIKADLEDSRIQEESTGGPPEVQTRQLTVNALLKDGVPLELTRVESEIDPSGFVEVEAKILR